MTTIAHLVVSDGFAGVERYVCSTAAETARRAGWEVAVIGGDPVRMREALPEQVRHRPGSSLRAARAQLLALRPFDLLHVHMTAAEAVAMSAQHAFTAPVVATRHFAQRRGSTARARLAAPVLRRALDLQLSVSAAVARDIGEHSLVLRSGVADRPLSSARDATVVMAQRLAPEKATALGLRAFLRSGVADAGWQLVIAGEGPEERRLRAVAAGHPAVRFVGFDPQVQGLLDSAGVLLAPTPREGLGMTVLEAMSSGTPVVAAAGGGHLELLPPAPYLFAPADEEDAARALRLACLEPGAAEWGAALRLRQQESFSLVGHVDRLVEVYEDVLGRGAVRQPGSHPAQ